MPAYTRATWGSHDAVLTPLAGRRSSSWVVCSSKVNAPRRVIGARLGLYDRIKAFEVIVGWISCQVAAADGLLHV